MRKLYHYKSSKDPYQCPQGPGETWRYYYNGEYLIVVIVEEAQDLHDEDGWRCLVLHGGHWEYTPGTVLDWAINNKIGRTWEKVE